MPTRSSVRTSPSICAYQRCVYGYLYGQTSNCRKYKIDAILLTLICVNTYRQNSDKLLATGFKQKFKVDDAIDEIAQKFRAGELADKEIFYNVKIMKKLFN